MLFTRHILRLLVLPSCCYSLYATNFISTGRNQSPVIVEGFYY